MTLQVYIDTLLPERQVDLAIRLTKLALPIWDKYVDNNVLTYRDTVVGLTHTVNKNLLKDTVETVEHQFRTKSIWKDVLGLRTQFKDPIIALQDFDWELPNEVKAVFYSVFNLLESFSGMKRTSFEDLTIYVSINQAIDAIQISGILPTEEIKRIIYEEGERKE